MSFIRHLAVGTTVLGLSGFAAQAQEIVVGGKNFTEQQILAAMTAQYLRSEGYDVDARAGLGSTTLRQAQVSGQVDVYWEYTGTSLINYNNVEEELNAEEAYQRVSELDAERGLVWLDPSDANNTYAIAMRADDAEERGISTITDLAQAINDGAVISFASNAEFYARADGLRPLQEAYGFQFGRPNIRRMDTGLVYQALRDEQVESGLVFATDGRVPAFDFTILEDDQGYFPDYALVPVARAETLEAHPELADQLNTLSSLLTDEVMAGLNASVDVDQQSIEQVAETFLRENDLL